MEAGHWSLAERIRERMRSKDIFLFASVAIGTMALLLATYHFGVFMGSDEANVDLLIRSAVEFWLFSFVVLLYFRKNL